MIRHGARSILGSLSLSSNGLRRIAQCCSCQSSSSPPLSSLRWSSTTNTTSDPPRSLFPGFRPQRRPDPNYRPIQLRPVRRRRGPMNPDWSVEDPAKLIVNLNDIDEEDEGEDDDVGLPPGQTLSLGTRANYVLEGLRRERDPNYVKTWDNVEAFLRMADYMTSEGGSLEDLQGERRALFHDIPNEAKQEEFMRELYRDLEAQRIEELDLVEKFDTTPMWEDDPDAYEKDEEADRLLQKEIEEEEEAKGNEPKDKDYDEPNNHGYAKGPWQHMILDTDTVQHTLPQGRKMSFRVLAIGGNGNGCAGFGIGKAKTPEKATRAAILKTRRNCFYMDRYENVGLSGDLAGKHNNCRVKLFATNQGLRGNPLMVEICLMFGIFHAVCKSVGRRSSYNIVYATFKAIMTNQCMENIALRRGRRLINLERARRLQV